MPLTQEQFQKARQSGFSTEQIIEFEKRRQAEQPETKFNKFTSPMNRVAKSVTDYLFPQMLTGAKFEPDKFNIYGDIRVRIPGAIRGYGLGKSEDALSDVIRGFQKPSEFPTFQKSLAMTAPITAKTKLRAMAQMYPSAVLGTAADVFSDPLVLGSGLMRKAVTPVGKALGRAGGLVKETGQKVLSSKFGTFTKESAMTALNKLKNISQSFPQIMNKNYTLNRAEKAAELIDDTRSSLGAIKGQAIAKYANRKINLTEFRQKVPILPENVMKSFDDPIYAIEKTQYGAIKEDLGNIDKMREALGDFMTSAQWEEATSKNKQLIKYAYGLLGKTVKKTVPEVAEPIEDYHKFMELFRVANSKLRNIKGTVLEKTFRGAFRKGAERRYQISWEELSNQIPELKTIISDLQKYNSREYIKKLVGKGLLIGAGFEAGRRFLINPLLRGIEDVGSGGENQGEY